MTGLDGHALPSVSIKSNGEHARRLDSGKSEANSLLDCEEHFLVQHLKGRILRQVKLIEAKTPLILNYYLPSMALRQPGDVSDSRDLELLRTSHPLQSFETFQRNLATAGDELQEAPDVFFRSSFERFPEPAHLGTVLRISCCVLSIGAQIVN